ADSRARGGRRPASRRARSRSPVRAARSPTRRGSRALRGDTCGRLAYRPEGVDVERGAAHERAVDVRLREELGGVVGLDRAAVENGRVEQRLDERVRFLRHLRRRGEAGADRPDRLVREYEIVVWLENRELPAENLLGLAALALLLGLAHARDHAQARVERRPSA